MNFCPTCHRSFNGPLNFCSRDGAALITGERFCPECCHSHASEFTFSPRHGARLVWVPADTVPLPPTEPVAPVPPRHSRRAARGIWLTLASSAVFCAGALLGAFAAEPQPAQLIEPSRVLVSAGQAPQANSNSMEAAGAPGQTSLTVRQPDRLPGTSLPLTPPPPGGSENCLEGGR